MDYSKHISGFLVTFACLLIAGLFLLQRANGDHLPNQPADLEKAAEEARQMLRSGKLQSAIKRRPAYKNVMKYRTVLARLDACEAHKDLMPRIRNARFRFTHKNAPAYKSWAPNTSSEFYNNPEKARADVMRGYPAKAEPYVEDLMNEFPLPSSHTDPVEFQEMTKTRCKRLFKAIEGNRIKIKTRTNEPLF